MFFSMLARRCLSYSFASVSALTVTIFAVDGGLGRLVRRWGGGSRFGEREVIFSISGRMTNLAGMDGSHVSRFSPSNSGTTNAKRYSGTRLNMVTEWKIDSCSEVRKDGGGIVPLVTSWYFGVPVIWIACEMLICRTGVRLADVLYSF